MKPSEAAIVLTKCAAYDRRTIGEADAVAWAEALSLRGVTLAEALEAVGQHYAVSREWIMPSDLSDIAVRNRKERRRAAGPPDYPQGLTQEQERRWLRVWLMAIEGGALPDVAQAEADRSASVARPTSIEVRPIRELAEGKFR